MAAYYNEFDPYAAQWLRNLIAAGRIAPGIVDERSIEDVTPADLAGFTQCHFFAGVGVWSLALRKAGWPDDRSVWTGSCPCQPFSTAGAGAGFADPRHLWPSFAWLIRQCSPAVVFGEQVASKAVEPWVDLVHADLEALGYAFGAVPFPSAGVGAPHIRDRLFWVGYSDSHGLHRAKRTPSKSSSDGANGRLSVRGSSDPLNRMAHPDSREPIGFDPLLQWEKSRRIKGASLETSGGGPVNGFWGGADWIGCRDDRFRPVEPGTFPLANGASSRVGRLRAYGNAINAQAAQEFIGSYLDSIDSKQSELDE